MFPVDWKFLEEENINILERLFQYKATYYFLLIIILMIV